MNDRHERADSVWRCLTLFLIWFLGTLRNQRDVWVLDQTFKVLKSKPYHPSYSGLVIGVHCLELRGGEGGCLGIWSSFLESLKLNKHPLKSSDNFNLSLSLCLTLSCAPPRHCLLGYSYKVPMALFPVPFLFLYIPARCVFGPLPSRSWWWAFCFFLKENFKGETANLCFSSTVWIVPQKAWAICSRQSVQIGLISISLLTLSAQTLTPPSPPEHAKKRAWNQKAKRLATATCLTGAKEIWHGKTQSAFPPEFIQ